MMHWAMVNRTARRFGCSWKSSRRKHISCYAGKGDFGHPSRLFLSVYSTCPMRGGNSTTATTRSRCSPISVNVAIVIGCAEAIHPKISEVGENLRQIFPMAGLIPTAMRSRSWEVRYWLD
jgi:hypothetical protein